MVAARFHSHPMPSYGATTYYRHFFHNAGGPDCLSIGAAKPQEDVGLHLDPSYACGTPMAELSETPARWKVIVQEIKLNI